MIPIPMGVYYVLLFVYIKVLIEVLLIKNRHVVTKQNFLGN